MIGSQRQVKVSLWLVFLLAIFIGNVQSAVVYWTGPTGKWSDASKWSGGEVPSTTSHVIVNTSSTSYLVMDQSVVVDRLEMAQGYFELLQNTTLNVSSQMIFEGGIFGCRFDVDSPQYSHIHVFGSSFVRHSGRKYLRRVYWHQHAGSFQWKNGDLIMYNSSILVSSSANMTVHARPLATTLNMQNDESRGWFDAYPNQVLNTDANLIYQYPPRGGVLDMTLKVGSRISTTRTSREMFPILVSQDLPSLEFYAKTATNVAFGYRYPMYNVTIADIDENDCAVVCLTQYTWCASFDYSYLNQTCRLSRFTSSEVGGLTVFKDSDSNNLSYPVRHFERRTADRGVDSYVVAYGALSINCDNAWGSGYCSFASSVNIVIHSDLNLEQNVNATFESALVCLSSSATTLGDDSRFIVKGSDSSLTFESGASISRTSEGKAQIALKGGNHVLNGTLGAGMDMLVADSARVDVYSLQSTIGTSSAASELVVASLAVESLSQLVWRSTSTLCNVSSGIIVSNSSIVAQNLTVFSTTLFVDTDASITASEQGFEVASGPSAGSAAALGASGGTYGGRGGPAKIDAAGSTYGSVIHPRQFGSGGGAGYFGTSSKGGASGGLIIIRSNITTVDGLISSDGGAGLYGGGGGSGGSIAIYCTYLSGDGSLSTNGGDGGFSGGLLSGGGGSGGRIALHADINAFNGTIKNYGGFTQPTYDLLTNEQSGAGTTFFLTRSVQAVLVSDQAVSNYVTHVVDQRALSSDWVNRRLTHQYLRGGELLDDQTSFDSTVGSCNVDLHVVGASPLTLAMSSFCLHRIFGSGEAQVHLRNGVNVTLLDNDLTLDGVNMTIFDAILPTTANITINNNASLGFQNLDHLLSPVNQNHGYYHLQRLEVFPGGSVVFHNATTFQVDELILHTNSTIELHGDVSLISSSVSLNGVRVISWSHTPCSLHIANTSVVSWKTTSDPLVQLSYSSLIIEGSVNVTATSALVEYEPSTSSSDTASTVTVASGGKLMIPLDGALTLSVPLQCYNLSSVNVVGSLTLQRGGRTRGQSLIHTMASSARVYVESDEFVLGTEAILRGIGQWSISNFGVLQLPPSLPATSAPIYVNSAGMVRVKSSSATSTFSLLSNIVLEVDGTFEIAANATTTVEDLDLSGGDIHFLSNASTLNIDGSGSVWGEGLVYGPGLVSVRSSGSLYMTTSVFSTNSDLRVEEAAISVSGYLQVSDIDVYWARGASVVNYGTLNFTDTVSWIYNRSILAFQDLGYRLYDVPQDGTVILHNRTKEECAKVCLFEDVTLYTEVAMQMYESATSECVSLVFNEGLQACKFFIDRFAEKETTFTNASWLSWQVYNKVESWATAPSFTNAFGGVVNVGIDGNASFGFPISNAGNVNIYGSRSTFLCDGGYEQVTSGSLHLSDGTFEMTSTNTFTRNANINVLSGDVSGTGTLRYMGNSSDGAANWTALTMTSTSLTIDIQSTVYVYGDVPSLEVKFFHVHDYGLFKLQTSSLTLTVTSQLHISSYGLMSSTDGGPVTSDTVCSTCFDYNITANTVVIESGGQLSMALGYLTADNVTVYAQGSIVADSRGYDAMSSAALSADTYSLTGAYGKLGCNGGGHAGPGGFGQQAAATDFDLLDSYVVHGRLNEGYTWGFAGGRWSSTNSEASRGGGTVIIQCSTLMVDGRVSSNGHSVSEEDLSGGGAGGSVRILATSLSGSGTLSANGGRGGSFTYSTGGSGGGGGGGRVVVYTKDLSNFLGSYAAEGGDGYQAGSPGIIYIGNLTSKSHGTLMCGTTTSSFTNGNVNPRVAKYAIVSEPIVFRTVDYVILNNDCQLLLQTDERTAHIGHITGDGTGALVISNRTILNTYTIDTTTSTFTNNSMYLSQATVVVVSGELLSTAVTIDTGGVLALTQGGGSSVYNTSVYSFENVTVHGELRYDYMTTRDESSAFRPVEVHVGDTLYVSAQGKISSDAQGRIGVYDTEGCTYGSVSGCGEFGAVGGGGGGHGGYGGSGFEGGGGQPHGSAMAPIEFGSGGGGRWPGVAGGTGGGSIYLNVTTLALYGTISADGAEGSGSGTGGGSGGSVYILSQRLFGTGLIHANGGDGLFSNVHFGGAGAGGRVLVVCDTCQHVASYSTDTASALLVNVTAHAGSYRYVLDSGKQDFQVPLWEDFGYTLKEWLTTMPSHGGAGSVVFRHGSTQALKIENPADIVANATTKVCMQYVVSSSYTLNCTRFPFALSGGVTPWLESGETFDLVEVDQNAWFRLHDDVSLTASTLDMDATGLVEVVGNWTFGSSAALSEGTFVLNGFLIGADDVTLSNGFNFSIAPNASWYQDASTYGSTASSYSFVYDPANLVTSVLNTSSITIQSQAGITFLGGSIYGDQRAVLYVTSMSLEDTNAYVTATGFGYPSLGVGSTAITKNETILNHQASGNISQADGGFHAGRGGGYYYSYPSLGNAFHPVAYGAAGGSTFQAAGSNGGGAIHIVARNSLHVAGVISANGVSCIESDVRLLSQAGGGAGGSIWLEVRNGNLTGNGTLSVTGGGGCTTGGGGGSGGRIAIYSAEASLPSFTGSLLAGGGSQNAAATLTAAVYPPAGGTVYISDVSLSTSMLTSTNDGTAGGSAVAVTTSCDYPEGYSLYHAGQFSTADVDLELSSCIFEIDGSVTSWASIPTLASALSSQGSFTHVTVANNATVLSTTSLTISDVTLQVKDSTIFFVQNLTMNTDAGLAISTFGSAIVGISAADASTIHSATQPLVNISTFLTSYADPIRPYGLSCVTGEVITLYNNSRVSYLTTEGRGWEDSNVFEATTLTVDHNATIAAKAVVLNRDMAWDASQTYAYFGASSEAALHGGASGGGHAGYGLAGSQSTAVTSSRGNLLFPYGPGGPGGNDRALQAYGGGGGGGLRFLVYDTFELNGKIDVSGGSASLSTQAGGGAGGSIYIDSPRAYVTGNGHLYANGGHGGVSSSTTQHGGAGSGGVIALRACVDLFTGQLEAKGGLAVRMPDWLPVKLTTSEYRKALAQRGLVASTTSYRKIQQVNAAPSGVISRHANQSSSVGISGSLLTHAQCQQNGYGWNSPTYQLSYLGSHGHTLSAIQAGEEVDASLVAAMVSSMQLSDVYSISEVVEHTTTLSLPIGTFNITHLKTNHFAMAGSHLMIQGTGTFAPQTIVGDGDSLVTLGGRMQVIPDPDFRFANMTWNFTDISCIADGGQTLEITDGGQLQIFNVDLTNANVAYPADVRTFLTGNCTISFEEISLDNDARLMGSKVSLSTETVTLQRNSSITATACGPYGGAGGYDATSGYGYGSGKMNEIGGDGGGFGGHGGQGLMSLYRQITEDFNLDGSGGEVYLNDSSLGSFGSRNSSKYGDYLLPIQMGSGGGGDQQHFGRGGRGGGVVMLYVHGHIYMDSGSEISADGESVYGGGGGGSGGSVWIRHVDGTRVITANPTVIYRGDIVGSGRISADGGKTCPQSGCMVSPDYPGGFGGGGRVRIEKVTTLFAGTLSARSGASNTSLSSLAMSKMGTVVRIPAISTLILNQTAAGDPVLDIVFTEPPAYLIQTITSRGQGSGDRYAVNASDAIVRGYWTLGYQAKYGHDTLLSAQATASEVQAALVSLGHPDLSKVSVARNPSDTNGWEWRVTFQNFPDRITPIVVDNSHLYCTSGQPSLTVEIFSPYNDSYATDYLGDNDAPASYDASELSGMLSFNYGILSSQSYAYWRNVRTLRVVPVNGTYNDYKALEEILVMESIFLIPNEAGFVSSLSPPYLKEYYDPNWKFPTSLPTNQPSMQPSGQPSDQPSGQPSGQPSSQPTMQPSSQPSSQPSMQPSSQPSRQPSMQPSSEPSMQPSSQPTSRPTGQPTMQPTMQPSAQPTRQPSMQPSSQPSGVPTGQPSSHPSMQPSSQPTSSPTGQPTMQPSMQPSTQPTSSPTGQPTIQPTMQPSLQPFSRPTGQPSRQPTMQPSRQPFSRPTGQPSRQPTSRPTMQPTSQPSSKPTKQPTSRPTGQPSRQPSSRPTGQPTRQPSRQPSTQPSSQPTNPTSQPSSQPTNPTSQPTRQPSQQPSSQPTTQPSYQPSSQPSQQPSAQPSDQPSASPTDQPSSRPTGQPTDQPSSRPTGQPSSQPSSQPTGQPTKQPSRQPTSQPTRQPTSQPTARPSRQPSRQPTAQPSRQPTSKPTNQPSSQPSSKPTQQPSSRPSSAPSTQPSSKPTNQPSSHPTGQPSVQPSSQPSGCPTSQPSMQPTVQPSGCPTSQPSDQPSKQPTSRPSHPSSQPSTSPTTQPSVSPSAHPSGQPFSSYPTSAPSRQPNARPSGVPTRQPSSQPSSQPSALPTTQPSAHPSGSPTSQPSAQPSGSPTDQPSSEPSCQPTSHPTGHPTSQPQGSPTTQPSSQPSLIPTSQPTSSPTTQPTSQPSTHPSLQPAAHPTSQPSDQPSSQPTSSPTSQPSEQPTVQPSADPTTQPSRQPSGQPSSRPSQQPTSHPSSQPASAPSSQPTEQPFSQPSAHPSTQPSTHPTRQPTTQPSMKPSTQPTSHPSRQPSSHPSSQPSQQPTSRPSGQPSRQPTSQPSSRPTTQPTTTPSRQPSQQPTTHPSNQPTSRPTRQPTSQPTSQPSTHPTTQPSRQPTNLPTSRPTNQPTSRPTNQPSRQPTSQPSTKPTSQPSRQPTNQPTSRPTNQPTSKPSDQPTQQPTKQPTTKPTDQPTSQPTEQPTGRPTDTPTSRPTKKPTPAPVV